MPPVKQMNIESVIQCQVETNTIKKNKTGKGDGKKLSAFWAGARRS